MVAAVDWASVGLGALASLIVGVGLWAFLPRGVVLTKRALLIDARGEPLLDTWELRNESAVPIRLTSVELGGPGAYVRTDEASRLRRWWAKLRRDEFVYAPEQVRPDNTYGVASLDFDDHVLSTARNDRGTPWSDVIVPPGETMRAVVPGLNADTIRYRRAGPFGLLERRTITIHGYG